MRQRARRPQARELVDVKIVHAEEHMRDARVDDVRKQQERYGEAECHLQRLPARQPQGGAAGELVERQPDVSDERAEQNDRAGPRPRHRPAPLLHVLHPVHAEEAERVIEEVRQDEREQDEPGGEPQPLEDVAAPKDVHTDRARSLLPQCIIAAPRL